MIERRDIQSKEVEASKHTALETGGGVAACGGPCRGRFDRGRRPARPRCVSSFPRHRSRSSRAQPSPFGRTPAQPASAQHARTPTSRIVPAGVFRSSGHGTRRRVARRAVRSGCGRLRTGHRRRCTIRHASRRGMDPGRRCDSGARSCGSGPVRIASRPTGLIASELTESNRFVRADFGRGAPCPIVPTHVYRR